MSDVNFTPTRGAYTELKPFRYWCQKVLPLVYDDSISYYELLCKVVNYLNITMEDVSTLNDDVTAMYTAYNELQDFVNQYFTDLNVQTQIDNKLDRMAADGSLNALIDPLVIDTTETSVANTLPGVVEHQLPDVVEDQIDDVVAQQIGTEVAHQIVGSVDAWLDQNVSAGDTVLDSTLTLYNAAARSNIAGILADNYGYYLGATQRFSNFETYRWYVNNNVAVRDTDPSPTFNSIVINPVSAGEKYTIKTSGVLTVSNNAPRYIFTDSNNNVIELSTADDLGAIAKTITVPAGATKLIINDRTFRGGEGILDTYLTTLVVKGELSSTAEISALKADLSATEADINKLIGNIQGTWTQGAMYQQTGIEYRSSSAIITPFIKVRPGDTIYFVNPDTNLAISVFEFANNTPTSTGVNERLYLKGVTQSVNYIKLSDTTNYIRLQMVTGDTSKGDDVLAYTPNNIVFNKLQNFLKNYPFDDAELIDFIPEYYQDDNTDLSVVTQVRIYNGNGGLYGFKLYNSSLETVVDCTFSSQQTGLVHKGNAYAVLNNIDSLGSQYKDFKNVTVNPCTKNIGAMPTIYSYIKIAPISSISLRAPFSNNDVNQIIKEYYLNENTDLSTVVKIRILNGLSGFYGFNLYDSNNNAVATFRSNGEPGDRVCENQSNGIAYAVIDNISAIGSTYKEYSTTVNDSVKNVFCMPNIYAYLQSIGDFYPFGSHELNKFIPEYYQDDDTDLSSVRQVRIYNGFSGLYGFKLYNSNMETIVDCTFSSLQTGVVNKENTYALLENFDSLGAQYKDFKNIVVSQCVKHVETMPAIYTYVNASASEPLRSVSCVPGKGQIIYEGDTKSNGGYIVNAVAYDDGVIIACRADGKVVRIGYSGTEETLLTISGTAPFDWRGCFMDSNENVYVSPHASYGSMNVSDRGLYRLEKGGNSFTKVIALYNSSSSVQTETENNDDTIWTMCEDDDGNLYAGVYAHTVRANPAIYKSTDGGITWIYLYNFITSGDTPTGRHIHSVIWSKWQKALYTIVGEVNTIFKSTDGGTTWTNLNVTLTIKGSSMLPTEFGIFVGSDGAYNCKIDILENDDKTHRNVFKGWANTVFAIRKSDLSGMLYAFTKIDSSVNSTNYFPPVEALTDPDVIDTWHEDVGDNIYNTWKSYHDSVVGTYPDDAIRPQHYAILVSRDGGNYWEPLKRFTSSSEQANGFWTTGYFLNGECLTGRMINRQMVKPLVISEGKHRYVSGGCDLSGEIFVKTNNSATVEVIS